MSNFFLDVIQPDPRFHSTTRIADMSLLEPVTRAAVLALINDAQTHGIALMPFETYRSQERQQMLFDQGASTLKTVGVHHYGLACDLVKNIGGEPSWKGDFSLLGVLGKIHGLIWGGDWGAPGVHHSFVDADHVQRCSLRSQVGLFSGAFYPDDLYNPYA
ncbi:M15 family metallopeptidase [Granulicella sibirica]|uniref:D-alanyl-D-alanine carboxypeptidase-like core domain-containing protein n=1 Tax=Granulicella sibirica TaxID=2479048 RepID=A0A4Q0T290_9BACT|nr:M15 family metallopeptidase [Granulicella sibirica]RXH57775.1 hypothetical protein GRAN_1085 [Granulicella sibirica]